MASQACTLQSGQVRRDFRSSSGLFPAILMFLLTHRSQYQSLYTFLGLQNKWAGQTAPYLHPVNFSSLPGSWVSGVAR